MTAAVSAAPVQSTPPPPAPKKRKLWLLTVCGIYPVLNLLALVLNPVLARVPWLSLRFAILVPVAVAIMVWIVTPYLTRRLGAWLVR